MTLPWTRAAIAAAAGSLLLGLTPLIASPAGAVNVPGGLKVARTGDGTDLAITWNATAGVDHYTVNVFDGTADRALVVPAATTSLRYDGSGICTRYRVKVTAVGSDGTIAVTNPYLVGSLGPAGVATLTAKRTESGASGVVSWTPPLTTGTSPVSSYTRPGAQPRHREARPGHQGRAGHHVGRPELPRSGPALLGQGHGGELVGQLLDEHDGALRPGSLAAARLPGRPRPGDAGASHAGVERPGMGRLRPRHGVRGRLRRPRSPRGCAPRRGPSRWRCHRTSITSSPSGP